MEIEKVHPWWSQNPDLKKIYDERLAEGQEMPEVEPEEDEEVDEIPEISLPEMTIEAGANPSHWIAKLDELRDTMKEELELEAMLRPVRDRKNQIIAQLKKLGVTIKK